MMRRASTLPSSTPHWSNESMCQTAPWVKTLCSYRATSLPRAAGVSRSSSIVFEGRLPSKVRWGTSQSGERFALREHVRQQHVVLLAQRVQRLAERDEVARDQPGSLMDQLIKGVLAVGAGLA